MTEPFILPDRLDSSAAPALVSALGQRVGQPLQIDAAGVEVIGALALEVIIAAGLQWQADGQPLAITQRSPRFEAACNALGLQADAPWIGAAGRGAEGVA
ncbi:STAS domain-containing protein [Paracoccus sp. NSM]|uniref:STAS domain-containing protein n=1 Tax=Paracoccus sp. NSM TaxID=3457784 RepID=UPI0040351080